eukprot:scaffold3120_cov219-Skeletonema_marinoi.AAC.13
MQRGYHLGLPTCTTGAPRLRRGVLRTRVSMTGVRTNSHNDQTSEPTRLLFLLQRGKNGVAITCGVWCAGGRFDRQKSVVSELIRHTYSTATVTVEIDGDYLASFAYRGAILSDGRTGMLYK